MIVLNLTRHHLNVANTASVENNTSFEIFQTKLTYSNGEYNYVYFTCLQEIYKKKDSSSPDTIQVGGSDGTAKPADQTSNCSSSSAGSESELLRKK